MATTTDIIKSAMYNEVRAAAFYTLASEITTNDESRMIFIDLAGQEEEHAAHIVKQTKSEQSDQGFDAAAYLQKLEAEVGAGVKSENNELLTNGDMRAVLDFAVNMEANARDTYKELAEQAVSQDVKDYCKKMADEEEKHRKTILQLLSSLDMSDDDRPGL